MSTTHTTVQLRDIAAGLVALDARLDQVAALPVNWDGYGGKQVEPAIVRAVREWGTAMPGWAFAPSPAVVPLSSGALQLEWRIDNRLLELEFETPACIHFLRWNPAAGLEDEDTFPITDRGRAATLIAWAVTGAEATGCPPCSTNDDPGFRPEGSCFLSPGQRPGETTATAMRPEGSRYER